MNDKEVNKFRKKPVVIEAIQLTPETFVECCEFVGEDNLNDGTLEDECYLGIITLEGDHSARKGDYIIKGIKGEFYPCKPDIFEATYDPVSHTKQEAPETISTGGKVEYHQVIPNTFICVKCGRTPEEAIIPDSTDEIAEKCIKELNEMILPEGFSQPDEFTRADLRRRLINKRFTEATGEKDAEIENLKDDAKHVDDHFKEILRKLLERTQQRDRLRGFVESYRESMILGENCSCDSNSDGEVCTDCLSIVKISQVLADTGGE